MPYIKGDLREKVGRALETIIIAANDSGSKPGVLNYSFSKILKEAYPHPKYSDFNEMIGILECAKMELYRAQAAPYEETKRKENGDL